MGIGELRWSSQEEAVPPSGKAADGEARTSVKNIHDRRATSKTLRSERCPTPARHRENLRDLSNRIQ
jgi:hypothetical protein